MITYEPFWETLRASEESTYTLITKHRISSSTIDKLRKNNETPLANHQYVKSTVSEKTCTADGITEFTCSVCGYTDSTTEPATGHNITEWKANTPPPLIHSGTCTICGETVSQNHTPGNYSYANENTHYAQCTVCDIKWRESHSGNPCSVCGGEY